MGARSGRRWARWVLGAVVVGWLVAVGWTLAAARSEGDRGLDRLTAVRKDQTVDGLLAPSTGAELDRAATDFRAARDGLARPWMDPLRVLPVIGRQLASARALNRGAQQAAEVGSAGLAQFRRVAAEAPAAGKARVQALRRLAVIVTRSRSQLATIAPGPDHALISPLTHARQRFLDARSKAVSGLASARLVLTESADLLDGPHHYLLLGANNAEMRAGSGMFLSAADLTTDGGTIHVGTVRPTDSLVLAKALAVGGDLARNWSWLPVGQDFRNLALTPRFDVSAPLAARMWAEAPGGRPVDGVIAVDVEALRGLLRVVGPVTVDGITYTAPHVDALLLHDQYVAFGSTAQRQDQLGAVAKAVLGRLQSAHVSVRDLATQLVAMVGGRHVLLWSADGSAQAAWRAADVDGHLTDRSLAVSTVSRSASKVDWFMASAVRVTTRRQPSGTAVTVSLTLANHTPPGQVRYVAGPNAPGAAAGEWLGVVVVNLPGAASAVTTSGGTSTTFRGADGPTQALGRYLRVPAGSTATFTVRFQLPPGIRSMVLEPTARVPTTQWTANGHPFHRDLRRTLSW